MNRRVEREWLDELPPSAPEAAGSRRDLRRLNKLMGNAATAAWALEAAFPAEVPLRLLELGAGDGSFLLQLGGKLGSRWRGLEAVLLDRAPVIAPETSLGFEGLGWSTRILQADALDWLQEANRPSYDVILANLFLHHFSEAQLARLFAAAARQTRVFVAVEPRRSLWPRVCTQFVGLLGCNRVTRHDAPVSVQAGFAGRELSRLWPTDGQWSLREGRAGMFSHWFLAQRSLPPSIHAKDSIMIPAVRPEQHTSRIAPQVSLITPHP